MRLVHVHRIVLLGMDLSRYEHVKKPLRRRECYRMENTSASQWRGRVRHRSRVDGTVKMNAGETCSLEQHLTGKSKLIIVPRAKVLEHSTRKKCSF